MCIYRVVQRFHRFSDFLALDAIRIARWCHSMSSVCLSVSPSVRPSVCRSVTLRYDFQTGWNTSKIISRPNSLRLMRGLTPTWAILCNGNTPQNWGGIGVGQKHTKPAISPKRCKIELGYYDRLIGSRIRAFDWCQNHWPWLWMKQKSTLFKINVYRPRGWSLSFLKVTSLEFLCRI